MVVTKKDFVNTVRLYKPNVYTLWMYSYFGTDVKSNDLWLRKTIIVTLTLAFITGFLGTILDFEQIVKWGTYLYAIILVILVSGLFLAVFFKNQFIRRVCKDLEINKSKFNEYSRLFWYDGILSGR